MFRAVSFEADEHVLVLAYTLLKQGGSRHIKLQPIHLQQNVARLKRRPFEDRRVVRTNHEAFYVAVYKSWLQVELRNESATGSRGCRLMFARRDCNPSGIGPMPLYTNYGGRRSGAVKRALLLIPAGRDDLDQQQHEQKSRRQKNGRIAPGWLTWDTFHRT